MGATHWWRSKQFGPFAALLAAQVLFMALLPIADGIGSSGELIRVGFTAVLIAGLGVTRENRRLMMIAMVLLVATVVMEWLAESFIGDATARPLLRTGLGAAYLTYLIVALIRTLSQECEATLDSVLGGINVYLLLALVFMELHLFMENLEPGSYVRAGLALSDPASHPHGSLTTTLFYFSFTTLTTLGYGDIAPARPFAQFLCSAEAVIGQLFVAIFIGGLVALRISGLQRESSNDS